MKETNIAVKVPVFFVMQMCTLNGTSFRIVVVPHKIVQPLQDKNLKYQSRQKVGSHRAI
ncbi:MAG: hypothetical protein AAFZ15_00600 [Bacteroidota bacterium]